MIDDVCMRCVCLCVCVWGGGLGCVTPTDMHSLLAQLAHVITDTPTPPPPTHTLHTRTYLDTRLHMHSTVHSC